jgi:histidinol-phosphate aminotransferase
MKSQTLLNRRKFMGGIAAAWAVAWPKAGSGKPQENTFTEMAQHVTRPVALNRNESPYGPFPAALEAMRAIASTKSKRYPMAEPQALQAALAKHFNVEPDQVLLGCGSIEILKMATDEFCSPTARPIVAEPTFEAVVGYCPINHTEPVKVPLTPDYRHDLEKMLAACGQQAGMVFMCNPANPTGTLLKKDEVDDFIRRVPESVVVLADEAYAEYVDRPDFESGVRYVREGRPNVVVSRTFSKIYGLAGLRVGYAIGPKALIKRMAPHRLWNNTNQLGTAAAMAGLADQQSMMTVRRLNAEARDFVYKELRKMGLEFIPSETNFVTINVKRPAGEIIEGLKQRQVLVGRPFPSIPHHVRVSLGTMAEMKLFVEAFRAVA